MALLLVTGFSTLAAQSEETVIPTPREAFDRAETLFSQGHIFTSEEIASLTDLKARLIESGDSDLAADLALLQMAATSQAASAEGRLVADTQLVEENEAWTLRDDRERNRPFWKGVRDWGLVTFTAATITTLILAVIADRDDALMRNGYFSDWSSRNQTQVVIKWTLVGSTSTMFLSLFPLLWGEARR